MHLMAQSDNKPLGLTAGIIDVGGGVLLMITWHHPTKCMVVDTYERSPFMPPLTDMDISETLNVMLFNAAEKMKLIPEPATETRN